MNVIGVSSGVTVLKLRASNTEKQKYWKGLEALKSENRIKRWNEREERNYSTSSQTPQNELWFGQEQTCTNRASNCESFGVGTGLKAWNAATKEWMATRRNWENSLSNLKKMRGKGQNSDRQSKILVCEKLTIISSPPTQTRGGDRSVCLW